MKRKEQKTKLPTTKVYWYNYFSTAARVVNRGGARSSKSHSVLQLLKQKFFEEEDKHFLILRKTLPALKVSTLLMFQQMLEDEQLTNRVTSKLSPIVYKRKKNLMFFSSLDDPEKAKSTEYNYILMEEANEFDYADFKCLDLRMSKDSSDGKPNQIFLLLNPIDEYHWIKTELLEGEWEDTEEIVSTYLDNPYLPDSYVKRLEGIKKVDPNYFKIYGLGQWGSLSGTIYTNWQVVKERPANIKAETFYGLDFGYNSEAALLREDVVDLYNLHPNYQRSDTIIKHTVFEEELIYKLQLTNSDLIEEMKKVIPLNLRFKPIYADSAEPNRIEEICRAGFNCKPADKSKNSVKNGIDFCKTLDIRILSNSPNLIKEGRAYSWKKDKNDKPLNEPVEINDHCMAARRYALFTHLKDRKVFNVKGQIKSAGIQRINTRMEGYMNG